MPALYWPQKDTRKWLFGQLAWGARELSPELPCALVWELDVICSCPSHQGTYVRRKVEKRALVGHQLFKESPSDFSHLIEQNQHLCPGRARSKMSLSFESRSYFLFKTKSVDAGYFWDLHASPSWARFYHYSVFTCVMAVCGWGFANSTCFCHLQLSRPGSYIFTACTRQESRLPFLG